MSRHRQKDEEVGVEGYGVLNTRKRMWKDTDGNIVTKKPALTGSDHSSPQHVDQGQIDSLHGFMPFQDHNGVPISPPTSHDPSLSQSTFDDHESGIAGPYPPTLNPRSLSNSGSYSPSSDQRFWSSNLPQPEPFVTSTFDDAPFDDIFNADTSSSFNNPFTTMSNYNIRPRPLTAGQCYLRPFSAFSVHIQSDERYPGCFRGSFESHELGIRYPSSKCHSTWLSTVPTHGLSSRVPPCAYDLSTSVRRGYASRHKTYTNLFLL
jgi:hypothetical protein